MYTQGHGCRCTLVTARCSYDGIKRSFVSPPRLAPRQACTCPVLNCTYLTLGRALVVGRGLVLQIYKKYLGLHLSLEKGKGKMQRTASRDEATRDGGQ